MRDIYENWKLYKEEIELLQELENIFLEYDNKVLNEGIMDKINDYMLKLSMKVVDIAKSSGRKALSLLSGAAGIVSRFKDKYPTLANILGTIIIAGGVYALMAGIDPSVAQADVVFDGKLLTQEELDAFEGLVKKIDLSGQGISKEKGFKIAANMRDLHNAENVVEFNKSMDGINGQVSAMIDRLRDYKTEKPGVYDDLVKAGENFSFRGLTTGTPGTSAID